jgi:hypothetical protein
MKLADLERDAQIEVPRELGRAVKALAADPRHQVAWRFILDRLCGQRRLSFVPGQPNPAELMIWFEGRRYVGEQLARIVEAPIPDDDDPPEPPARTLTERARRRTAKKSATTEG